MTILLIDSESVMIVKRLGIQCNSTCFDGSSNERFVTWEELRGVAILEAMHRFHFIFYLAAWERWPRNPQAPLLVLFPVCSMPSSVLKCRLCYHVLISCSRCEMRFWPPMISSTPHRNVQWAYLTVVRHLWQVYSFLQRIVDFYS